MEPKTVARPLAVLSALCSLFIAPAPSASAPVGTPTVCATGTCCDQHDSICNDGGNTEWLNKYYKTSGSCTSGS